MIFGLSCASHCEPNFPRVMKEKVLCGSPPRWRNAYSINIETPDDLLALMDKAGDLIISRRDAWDAQEGPGKEGDPTIRVYDGFIE